MATKEDILEQVVEEYLTHKGYFVRHNIKFLPDKTHRDYVRNQDSNHSDIDVLAIHPRKMGSEKVWAVSCKSWQSGFNAKRKLFQIENEKKDSGRAAWKRFRELANDKWAEAFVRKVREETGHEEFTYVLAVSHVVGDRALWENHAPFRRRIRNNPIKIVTFHEMVLEIGSQLTRTLAATEIGRMLQMFKGSNLLVTSAPEKQN